MTLGTYAPIEQLLAFAQENKLSRDLQNRLERLVDITSVRVQSKDLEKVSDGLLDDLLELRIASIQWIFSNNNHDIFDIIEEGTKPIKSPYQDLNEVYEDVMATYLKVVSNLVSNLDINISNDDLDNFEMSYQGLKNLVQLSPIPELKNFLKWMESSLKLELGFLVAALIEDKKIEKVDSKLIKDLKYFLRRKVELFGAYAIILGIWKPSDIDHSQLITNIKIVASTFQMEWQKSKPVSKIELENLLLLQS